MRTQAIPDKPLSDYTAEDHRLLRSPSVEAQLDLVRETLALVTVLATANQYASREDPPTHAAGVTRDAAAALARLAEAAYQAADALSGGLSSDVQNLRVVR